MQQKLRALITTVELTKDKVGLETLKELLEEAKEMDAADTKMYDQLQNGREYLMGLENINVSTIIPDTLEAFGFGRNGLD